MTVAELRAALALYPMQLDVYLESECCGCSVLAKDVCISDVQSGEVDPRADGYEFVAVSG